MSADRFQKMRSINIKTCNFMLDLTEKNNKSHLKITYVVKISQHAVFDSCLTAEQKKSETLIKSMLTLVRKVERLSTAIITKPCQS